MSSPPQTPTHRPVSSHRRNPSSLDMSYNTPSRRQSLNRRSSGYSPITPRSSHEFEHGSPAQHFDGGGDGNGLGNLADELGEIWDDDEEEGIDGEFGEELDMPQDELANIGTAIEHDGSSWVDNAVNLNGVRDSGVAMQSSSPARLSPEAAAKSRKHTRQRSLYDGSDYGEDSDFENEGISPALESRMAAVESLARRGMEENGSASDQVVKRVTEQLRDLGSQIAIENGATRLKTAHDALTTHLTHQSRTLTSLAASFSGPRPIIPDPDTIDTLLPLIQSTLELLPQSSTEPLISLSHLTLSTRELLQHLANVSDTLHMSRQTTANATRRLKVSKEQLQDWKREDEKSKEGHEFIEHGDWDRRLREREAKRACASVLDGFEDVCGMWRKRLCEGLGVASA
ncbi:Nn.00g034430.m01.CDS01 [Neocucurbitaria sp. VM-36]